MGSSKYMSHWDQELYSHLRRYRSRSLFELEKRIGDIRKPINNLILRGKRARVLEVGHGFGSVLIQLLKYYDSKIELHAISIEQYWGSWDVIQRNALQMNILDQQELAVLEQPAIHIADINYGLPFPSDYFDFIYSQVSFFQLKEKLFFLEECSRVLNTDGLAWIDINPLKLLDVVPPELAILLDIRTSHGPIEFWNFIKNMHWLSRRHAAMRDCVEIRKDDHPSFNASLQTAINLNDLRSDWQGVKSIYKL